MSWQVTTRCESHIDHSRWRLIAEGSDYQTPTNGNDEFRNAKPIKGRKDYQIVVCKDCGRFIAFKKIGEDEAKVKKTKKSKNEE